MGHLDAIEKAAQKLIALCQKEKQTKTDKEKMLAIQAEILAAIENLAECERCGSISEIIVTMTLADVTAKLCKECGVKSLEAGKIQSSKPQSSKQGNARKRAPRAKTPTAPSTQSKSNAKSTRTKQAKPVEEPESPAVLHTRVEAQTGIKKADVKKLHKIVQDIAAPMSPEHTLTYVQREVEIAKMKVDANALEKAVTLLTHQSGSQVVSAV